jgi:hypothetical protein
MNMALLLTPTTFSAVGHERRCPLAGNHDLSRLKFRLDGWLATNTISTPAAAAANDDDGDDADDVSPSINKENKRCQSKPEPTDIVTSRSTTFNDDNRDRHVDAKSNNSNTNNNNKYKNQNKNHHVVSFDRNVVMRYYIHLNDMTRSEIESSFLQPHEYRQIRRDSEMSRRKLDLQESQLVEDSLTSSSDNICNGISNDDGDNGDGIPSRSHQCYNGIRSTNRLRITVTARCQAMNAVLTAQQELWKRIDGRREGEYEADNVDDYDMWSIAIARAYQRVLNRYECQLDAFRIGLQCQHEARSI